MPSDRELWTDVGDAIRRACDREAAERTHPTMYTLALELDAPHEPPTAIDPADLPDPSPNPYPLARIDRRDMSIRALLWYLVRLWVWRRRARRSIDGP